MSEKKIVREFHHKLLWPITLRPLKRAPNGDPVTFWDTLKDRPGPWEFVEDALLIEDESCLAGYEEFVHFLPYVQRFLYGVGDDGQGALSSLHTFQRHDLKEVRIRVEQNSAEIALAIRRARLYFFYDIDIALAVLEVSGNNLPLETTIDIIDRFGRPYPPAWEQGGRGAHCLYSVEFWGADEQKQPQLLSTSDFGDREKYLELVRNQRQTPLSMHWEFFLSPLVPAYLRGGTIKYYQIENKRIPIMSYLSFDDPHQLSRGDMTRIGFAAKWGESATLPYAGKFLANFEQEYCYDRYWDVEDRDAEMSTRYIFCGVAFAMITTHKPNDELLRQFRHQFFQIGLIAHFHKASLLSLSNRFSRAVERLNVRDFESVKQFKKHVRETLEVFLRFNHRYWFHEISNQVQASDFFKRWSHQLGSDALYNEVREEARDINEYLDTDRARKQTDNAMRLTVVSSCGMVGTVVTGFLGMNLYSHSDLAVWHKILIFMIVFIPATALGVYTVMISRRLANFMEALSSEGLSWREKLGTFRQIWYSSKRERVLERREKGEAGLTSGE